MSVDFPDIFVECFATGVPGHERATASMQQAVVRYITALMNVSEETLQFNRMVMLAGASESNIKVSQLDHILRNVTHLVPTMTAIPVHRLEAMLPQIQELHRTCTAVAALKLTLEQWPLVPESVVAGDDENT